MNQFYVSLIFIGIILVSFSLILVMLDKKKPFSFIKGYEDKKQELVQIINDAEQMIEELNKFSDYIVTQMDFKNEELQLNIKKADEEIKNLAGRAQAICIQAADASKVIKAEVRNESKAEAKIELKPSMAINGSYETAAGQTEPLFGFSSDYMLSSKEFESNYSRAYNGLKSKHSRSDNVISINNKYDEVLRLSGLGMTDIEIAKKLNMGKGEVQLILELNNK